MARARARAPGRHGLLDGRRHRAEARRRLSGRTRAGSSGSKARPTRPGATTSFLHHPAIHGGELCAELHLRPQLAVQPGSRAARELVVLQPVRPRRLSGRRALLQHRLGRARRHQAHRHQPVQGLAAHRRIRLFLHAGDDRGGRTADPRRAPAPHEGHGAFPDDRELPGFRPYLLDALDHIVPAAAAAHHDSARVPAS